MSFFVVISIAVLKIRTKKPDFSFEVILNSDSARLFDEIRCETTSFPAAEVVWTLDSDDYDFQDVSNITNGDRFRLVNSGSIDNVTMTTNAIINMTNLQYTDDGNFTCTATNKYLSKAQWAVLRVKSMFHTFCVHL